MGIWWTKLTREVIVLTVRKKILWLRRRNILGKSKKTTTRNNRVVESIEVAGLCSGCGRIYDPLLNQCPYCKKYRHADKHEGSFGKLGDILKQVRHD